MSPVSKVPDCPVANRTGLSSLQQAILGYLATTPRFNAAEAEAAGFLDMRGWPRTGDIIDAIGRQRDKKGFASVSRSLTRLGKADLIVVSYSQLATRGRGAFYALRSA